MMSDIKVNKEGEVIENDVGYKIPKIESFEWLRNRKEAHVYRIILQKYAIGIIE